MGERSASIIGVRITPSDKERMKEEAKKRGWTLTHFVWTLLQAGWREIVEGADVKQLEGGTKAADSSGNGGFF